MLIDWCHRLVSSGVLSIHNLSVARVVACRSISNLKDRDVNQKKVLLEFLDRSESNSKTAPVDAFGWIFILFQSLT